MRCVIANYAFDLTANEVKEAMSGVKPEPITGPSVRIGRRTYPAMQVGAVVTRQDRRDFTAGEVVRAMKRLGFTCEPAPAPASEAASLDPVAAAAAALGSPADS
ncbi:SCO5918 family protein [Streptomyces milbemycinicus]|uniref:SCO5918 family protein n=1 Tax=Streptomyces milbemycinicus TaxID=476552 RepID=A0ABW8LPQ3_9ACTN